MRKPVFQRVWILLCLVSGGVFALDGQLFYQDFEDANSLKGQEWKGHIDGQKGYGASKCSMKGDVADGKSFVLVHDPKSAFFTTTRTSQFRCEVWVSADTQVEILLHSRSKGFLRWNAVAKANEWVTLAASTIEFLNSSHFKNVTDADVDEIKVSTLSPADLWVDDLNVSATSDGVEASVAVMIERARTDKTAAKMLAERRAQTLDPARNFAWLTPECVRYLREKVWKKDMITPKTVLNVGDDLAINYSFWKPLFGARGELDGYSLLDKTFCATAGASFDSLKTRFQKTLTQNRPEVVTFCIGRVDSFQGRGEKDIRDWFDFFVNSAMEAGAVPVLYTPAYPNSGEPALREVYLKLATLTRSYAMAKRIPLVDAWLLVSDNPNFATASGPTSEGMAELNKVNLLLYTKLDEWVFERRPKVVPPLPELDLPPPPPTPAKPPTPVAGPNTAPVTPIIVKPAEPEPGSPEAIKKKLADTE